MANFFNNAKNLNNLQSNIDINDSNFDTLQKAYQDLIGEIGAVSEYSAHIRSSNSKTARITWETIRNEELMHIGELLALIDYLDPSLQQFVNQGINEFNERIN